MNVKEAQDQLTAIINEIIEIKSAFQTGIPVGEIIISKKDKLGKQLIGTNEKIQKLLSTLGLKEDKVTQASGSIQATEIQSLDTEGLLVVACRNLFAEKLDGFKHVYLDRVITGGPLELKRAVRVLQRDAQRGGLGHGKDERLHPVALHAHVFFFFIDHRDHANHVVT